MNICIVEDEVQHLKHLITLLQKWEAANDHSLRIKYFSSGEDLLSKPLPSCHVFFLDIQLQKITGIDLARALRERGYTNEIVFLTAYREYVFEGYNVHALNYLIKPAQYEALDSCLQYVRKQLSDSCFQYRYKDSFFTIPYHDILYFSSSNHYVEIVTPNQRLKQVDSLKNILKFLPDFFVPCHRTLIVNIHHVQKIQHRELYLSNHDILPISNTYVKQVESAFIQKAF